jgi:hypothetical protein
MMLLGVAPLARADTIDDPLHGHCLAGCISNGTNTPIIGPTNGFYFQASPGPQTGIMLIDVLVPNNVPTTDVHVIIGILTPGGILGGSLLTPEPTWTSGTLGDYLSASGSQVTPNIKPTNPIGAFLPATQAIDPGATGFRVYETPVLSDPQTLAQEGSPPVPGVIFNVSGSALPLGSYVLVNLVQSDGKTIATANESALFAGSACTTCSNPPALFADPDGSWPDCRRWPPRSDRGSRWASRLVATAKEDRLSFSVIASL